MVRKLIDTEASVVQFLGVTMASVNRMARPKEMAELDGTSNFHLPLRPRQFLMRTHSQGNG